MELDIKGKVEEIVEKIKEDPALLAEFQKEPVKAIEKVLGIDLPDEKLQPLVAGVKAKLASGEIGDVLDGLKKLF
jgi:hypothetical protein